MKNMYEHSQRLTNWKKESNEQRKNEYLQRDLRECTFKPKKISRLHLNNRETFEQRQEKWKINKQSKIDQMQKQSKMEKLNECTFNPEILSPEQNHCYDEDFYNRQIEWYCGVHENIKNYKEEMFKKNHRNQPKTFISPFVQKEDVKESPIGEYIRSSSAMDKERGINESNFNGSGSIDQSRFEQYNTPYTSPAGEFHNFQNQEVADAQNIFNTQNLIFDTKHRPTEY